MSWLAALLSKIVWWALPKVIGAAVDYVERALALVEAAETECADSTQRRQWVMDRLACPAFVPETAERLLVESCVILFRIGVTVDRLRTMQAICEFREGANVFSVEKRKLVLEQFAAFFPDIPERVARLLLELAVARIRSSTGGAG